MPCLAITGANGFVGRHLTKSALSRGWSVRAFSRRTEWLESLEPNAGLSVHTLDLTEPPGPEMLAGVDTVCHLAAYLPANYTDAAVAQACLTRNALATLSLLNAAREAEVPHFIYYSSGNSYSAQERMVKEEDALFPSRHAVYYLSSKLVGEMYCEHARIAHGQQTAVLRLSSVYGPGQAGGVVLRYVQNLVSGLPIRIADGGRHRADFVFVDDVIQATWRVIETRGYGIFNVGSGQNHTVLELAMTITELTAADSGLVDVQLPLPGPASGFSALDITRARSELGYEPTPLKVGLTSFAEAQRHLRS